MVQAIFVDELKEYYLRTCKNPRKKNLRCFPNCSVGGHVTTRFCGRCLTIKLSGLDDVLKNPLNRIYAWGEFLRADEESARFTVGEKYAVSEMSKSEKGKEVLMRGETQMKGTFIKISV